jgi:ribonuclease PH
MRHDGRAAHDLRTFSIEPDFIGAALGSVLVSSGRTRIICTASETKLPGWIRSGGWVTAEYAMLPGATAPRGGREVKARSQEIQRLIGRSLRAACDLSRLVGESAGVAIVCDCDVIEADGGTRTAAITGAFVALHLALRRLFERGALKHDPRSLLVPVAAVSAGIVPDAEGLGVHPLLDLCYVEDASAIVDLNVVMRSGLDGLRLVEIQGTGEQGTFGRKDLDRLLDLAEDGIALLVEEQMRAISKAMGGIA